MVYDRGILPDTLDKFRLGWYNGYSMIPITEQGELTNFQMRRDRPDKQMKVFYSGQGGLLFNSDILPYVDYVFYVEGPVDAIVMAQNGLPTVCSTISGGFLPKWYGKFIHQKRVYVLFDHDSAGFEESERIAFFMGTTRTKIYNFTDFSKKGYDPVDFFRDGLTKKDLWNLVEVNSKYVFE